MLHHLDLFSGIGGFALGLRWAGGYETIGFSEVDPYCNKLLEKNFAGIKNYGDIKKFDATGLRGMVDVLTGGYPCQPFSFAGRGKGEKDERHLWPEMFRIIQECRPRYIVCENVCGHIKLGLDAVLSQVEGAGYALLAPPLIIPASAVTANHERYRIWIIAHANSAGLETPRPELGSARLAGKSSQNGDASSNAADAKSNGLSLGKKAEKPISRNNGKIIPNARGQRSSGSRESLESMHAEEESYREADSSFGERVRIQWAVEPAVGRVAHGVSSRVDRLKGLGNAVVPQIPEAIGITIRRYDNLKRRDPK